MTDAEIEAGGRDKLAEEVAADMRECRDGKSCFGGRGDLILPAAEAVADVVNRLRAAGISEATLWNALLHEPRKNREYFAKLANLQANYEAAKRAGNDQRAGEIAMTITMHRLTMHSRYGKCSAG